MWADFFLQHVRYGGVPLLSFWMMTLQAQKRHRLSQKGRCMYSETGECFCRPGRLPASKSLGPKEFGPDRCGRITGVAWAGAVVAVDKFFAYGEFLAHFAASLG